jgi:hypothetical protein
LNEIEMMKLFKDSLMKNQYLNSLDFNCKIGFILIF